MLILIFFTAHWYLSLFFQTFFQHRYASHRMFNMTRFWERVVYLLALLFQGSSFLNPRAYALMHRDHHAHSDTTNDPHSPHFFKDIFRMMAATVGTFRNHLLRRVSFEKSRAGYYPEWYWVDRIGSSVISRLTFGAVYTCYYILFAAHWWLFLLLPVQFLMGPIQGAIVNWCGHKYGYRNFELKDKSRNTSPFGFLLLGELFQNNHHRRPNHSNFASKWFEIDPVYWIMLLLQQLKVIRIGRPLPVIKPIQIPRKI